MLLTKQQIIAWSLLLFFLSSFESKLAGQVRVGPDRPNVIFIFPDQYRNSSLGIWSQPGYQAHLPGEADPVSTPALDKMAAEGVVFNRAVSNFPLCSPYRAMLVSGRYPNQNGVEANCRKDRDASLKSDATCVTDVFAAQGYQVSYFGKVHWLKNEPLFNEDSTYVGTVESPGGHYINGYDTYLPPGPDRHSIDYMFQVLRDDHFDPLVYSSDPKLIEGKSDGELHKPRRFSAEVESEAIIKYLENTHGQRNADQPFFMIWSLNPPHNPWDEQSTKMEFYDQYTENGDVQLDKLLTRENADPEAGHYAPYYFANVSAVDHYIGQVLDKLEDMGLDENTIVVFSSDHGEMLGSHSRQGKNVPETESLNIPFMIKWGNRLQPRVVDRIVNVPDVMPTLLGLSGLGEAIPDEVQGDDFSELILNPDSKQAGPEAALIMGYNYRGVYNGRYTFVVEEKKKQVKNVFCYDNQKDPYQLNRLSTKEMGRRLEREMKTMLVDLLVASKDRWVKQQIGSDYLTYP